MSGINNLYINALLADASYVDLDRGAIVDSLGSDLTKRMTQTLSTYIANNFTVVDSINSGEYFGSGFDATVWREKTGQIYVSMRGTEGIMDFVTDGVLAITGNARGQLVDMVNWWLRISTPTSQMATQIRYESSVLGLAGCGNTKRA